MGRADFTCLGVPTTWPRGACDPLTGGVTSQRAPCPAHTSVSGLSLALAHGGSFLPLWIFVP